MRTRTTRLYQRLKLRPRSEDATLPVRFHGFTILSCDYEGNIHAMAPGAHIYLCFLVTRCSFLSSCYLFGSYGKMLRSIYVMPIRGDPRVLTSVSWFGGKCVKTDTCCHLVTMVTKMFHRVGTCHISLSINTFTER